jgi:hypothetical protein
MSGQTRHKHRSEDAEIVYKGLRKVHESGNSLVVSIPIEEAQACGLDKDEIEGTKVAQLRDDGSFSVELDY